MTARPEDLQRRLDGLTDIGQVVGALRAIASGHTASARTAAEGILGYAGILERAIGRVMSAPIPEPEGAGILIVIGAAQGFSGSYPARVAETALAALTKGMACLVVGQRTLAMMEEGLGDALVWSADLPAQPAHIPALASDITDVIAGLADTRNGPIQVVSGSVTSGLEIGKRQIWPPVPIAIRPNLNPPMTYLPIGELVEQMLGEYLFAQIALALTTGFEAENQARFEAMARAQKNLATRRDEVLHDFQQARQEQMTTEIIELSSARLRP